MNDKCMQSWGDVFDLKDICLIARYLLLFADGGGEFCVADAWVELTAHQRGSLVVFDVAQVRRLGQLDLLTETLHTQPGH